MASILKNPGDTVTLPTTGLPEGEEIRISLRWSHEPPGLLKRILGRGRVDLDLGCYFETTDGRHGVIDGLQFAHQEGGPRHQRTAQGCYDFIPYVWHTGDNAGIDSEAVEVILVNPAGLARLRRLMVYCFIYDGIGQWLDTDAVLSISIPGQDDVQVEVGRQSSRQRFCLVASIDFTDGKAQVRRMAQFYDSHSQCGADQGWHLRFAPGYK